MDVNVSTILSGASLAAATAAFSFAFSMAQRVTKAETKLEFIYERLRWSIATDIKANPHPDDARLEALTETFLQRTIGRKDLKTLVEILETRIKEHPIEKEQMKARNLLELICYEYQIGDRLVRSLHDSDADLGNAIHGLSRRLDH